MVRLVVYKNYNSENHYQAIDFTTGKELLNKNPYFIISHLIYKNNVNKVLFNPSCANKITLILEIN